MVTCTASHLQSSAVRGQLGVGDYRSSYIGQQGASKLSVTEVSCNIRRKLKPSHADAGSSSTGPTRRISAAILAQAVNNMLQHSYRVLALSQQRLACDAGACKTWRPAQMTGVATIHDTILRTPMCAMFHINC
jgi:hypothetical protein